VVVRGLSTILVLGLAFTSAHAKTNVNPEDEYKKLIKVNEEIQPLGRNL
jgi:hypothetical protein